MISYNKLLQDCKGILNAVVNNIVSKAFYYNHDYNNYDYSNRNYCNYNYCSIQKDGYGLETLTVFLFSSYSYFVNLFLALELDFALNIR